MTVPITGTESENQEQHEQKNDKEYNFSQMRKQLEQERMARQYAEERAAQVERALKEKQAEQEKVEEPIYDPNDPYVDHKVLEKRLKNMEKNQQKVIAQTAKQIAEEIVEKERQTAFLDNSKDYNNVMTEDNFRRFAERYPQIAKSLMNMPATFERQKLVYENMKALGVDKPEGPKTSIQDTINRNQSHPGHYFQTTTGTAPYSSQVDFSPAGQKKAYEKLQALLNK